MQWNVPQLDTHISAIRLRSLLRKAGLSGANIDLEKAQATTGQALLVWVAGILAARKPVGEEQQDLVLDTYAEALIAIGDEIATRYCTDEDQPDSDVKVAQLVIIDNTFVGLSGQNGMLDLRVGSMMTTLMRAPIEVVSYNLTALTLFHIQRLKDLAKPCPESTSDQKK